MCNFLLYHCISSNKKQDEEDSLNRTETGLEWKLFENRSSQQEMVASNGNEVDLTGRSCTYVYTFYLLGRWSETSFYM
jgi:hypothetical protein